MAYRDGVGFRLYQRGLGPSPEDVCDGENATIQTSSARLQ